MQDAEMEFAPSHVRTLCRVRKTVVVYLRLVNLIADSMSSLSAVIGRFILGAQTSVNRPLFTNCFVPFCSLSVRTTMAALSDNP